MKGLYFKKLDLHVHTPASKCFKNKTATPKNIINKAKKEHLEAIAITDHNTAEWINKMKEEAQRQNFVVFPGVEITSETGIHILAIFDTDKDASHVNHLLSCIGINPDEYGKSTTTSKMGHIKIIEKINELGAICILPHIDDHKGAFKVLDGNPRQKLFKECQYEAVETISGDLPDKLNNIGREIVVIKSSDNPDPQDKTKHSIEGIGSRFTYFKLDECINLEGIKQCLYDSEVRIKIVDSYKEESFPKIVSIKVSDGFLKHQNINFHSGLNSIIGGKGVGKSLIIEFLRFVLSQESADKSIQEDHNSKLKKRLGLGESVECVIELESGKRFTIKRFYDDTNNQVVCTDNNGEEYKGNFKKLFPILAYSQTEVIKISENTNAQLELIDSFVDIDDENRKLKDLKKKLKTNDNELAKTISAKEELNEIEKEIKTLSAQIKEFDSILNKGKKNSKVFDDFKILEERKSISENQIEVLGNFQEYVNDFKNSIEDLSLDMSIDDNVYTQSLKSNLTKIENHKKQINEMIDRISIKQDNLMNDFNEKYEKLLISYNKKDVAYKESLADQKESRIKNAERKKAVAQESNLKRKMKNAKEQSSKYEKLKVDRDVLLKKYDKTNESIFMKRKQVYLELSKKSDYKIKLEILQHKNRSNYFNKLSIMLSGSNIRKEVIKAVTDSIMPRELIYFVFNRMYSQIVKTANISKTNSMKIVDKLNLDSNTIDLLELEYGYTPEDKPRIQFRIDKKSYAPLKELSVGQKCTALLIVGLSEGKIPVIIDQPEDALDITTVWEDISKKLRKTKEQRQFILTTHNASVAVSSDSDMYVVVRSNSSIANVKCLGGIEVEYVKEEVINHLEGGRIPYVLRSKKYNVNL